MAYRYGIWYIDIVIYHIDMVIRDIDMKYSLMIWEMTVSIRSLPISIWDILSLWAIPRCGEEHEAAEVQRRKLILKAKFEGGSSYPSFKR
jgi:hypothetical protein